MNPINLAVRFALELTGLSAIGYWGWQLFEPRILKFVFAMGLPIIAAVLWGVFAVPGDPSRSGNTVVAVPGYLRLLLEFSFFGFAVWCTYKSISPGWAVGFAVVILAHYAASFQRIQWLLKQ